MLTTDKDRQWLAENYPGLTTNEVGDVEGIIEFSATYNHETKEFLILRGGVEDTVGGRQLSVKFKISIQERKMEVASRLPLVNIEGITPEADRHINRVDGSACLCSPLEENQFLEPFDFPRFFEELVIPFLYGQVFYDQEKHWPWAELNHGAVGLLEDYARIANPNNAQECSRALAHNDQQWNQVRALLIQVKPVRGHATCFCKRRGKIRDCHPEVLKGIEMLRKDIWRQNIQLPGNSKLSLES